MRRRRLLLILPGVGFVAVLAVLLWPREREPIYQGKKLSEWLSGYRKSVLIGNSAQSRTIQECERAVREIGTNGLPYLFGRIKAVDPQWKAKACATYEKLPPWLQVEWAGQWLGRNRARALDAMSGFQILRSTSSPAIPQLKRLADGAAGREVADRAVFVLSSTQEGRQAMIDLIGKPGRYRRLILSFLEMTPLDSFSDRSAAIAGLVVCLHDEDVEVRVCASRMLAQASDSEDAVVGLVGGMEDPEAGVRASSIVGLGRFGVLAQRALPKLLEARDDLDFDVRQAATNTIRKISE